MVYVDYNKLNRFNLTKDNFYIVMDFDMTITDSNSPGSWGVLENPKFINPRLKEESHKLIDKYYPYELDYNLDIDTKTAYMEEWYQKNMDLLYEYGLTYDILINCVKYSKVNFRNGFKKFFSYLHNNNIPIIILSAGIGNVIYEILKLNNCLYDNVHIISNFIEFQNNKMKPFSNNMIHSCNKNLSKIPTNFSSRLENKDYILLFGDLIEDLNMVSKEDLTKTISFGFLEKKIEVNLEFYKNAFNVVLTNNSSFNDVFSIIENLINNK